MVFAQKLCPQHRRRTLMWLGVLCLGLGLNAPSNTLSAQEGDVTGIVRDSLNNETLPNAVVFLMGERFRTLTDEFGRFTLVNVPIGEYTLRVEYLGYLPLELEITGDSATPLSVLMTQDAFELEGVTV